MFLGVHNMTQQSHIMTYYITTASHQTANKMFWRYLILMHQSKFATATGNYNYY